MAAPKGNRFAAKKDDEKFSESLFIRVRPAEKEVLRQAAGSKGFSQWARGVLLTSIGPEKDFDGQPVGLRDS